MTFFVPAACSPKGTPTPVATIQSGGPIGLGLVNRTQRVPCTRPQRVTIPPRGTLFDHRTFDRPTIQHNSGARELLPFREVGRLCVRSSLAPELC